MRILRNSSRHGRSAAITSSRLMSACIEIAIACGPVVSNTAGERNGLSLGKDRVGDNFPGLSAGLRSAIAVLLYRVADAPQAFDARFSRQIVTGAATLRWPIVPHHADRKDLGLIEVWKLLAQIGERQFDFGVRVEIAKRRDRYRIGDIEMPARRREFGAGSREVRHIAEPARLSERHDPWMGDQRFPASDVDDDVRRWAKAVSHLLNIGGWESRFAAERDGSLGTGIADNQVGVDPDLLTVSNNRDTFNTAILTVNGHRRHGEPDLSVTLYHRGQCIPDADCALGAEAEALERAFAGEIGQECAGRQF